MTSAEFKIAFETRFYAATTVNGLGWSNDEISEFLNYSQNSLVWHTACYVCKDHAKSMLAIIVPS